MLRLWPGPSLAIALSLLLATPALTHTVKVAGDIAATFHIEPDHNPQAGKTSLLWFVLTQRGGQTLPVSQCNCRLSIYALPRSDRPLLQPNLVPIDAERYEGIPGAHITFPQAGRYELVLTGSPKGTASFQPFTLTYSVDVRN